MRAYSTLRSEGVKEPTSRKQILEELLTLIKKAREEGFEQVSLTMGTTGVYQYTKDINNDMQLFIQNTHLVNPYYNKFRISSRTHLWG
jgi:cobalamin biosynthesis protein CbiD